jgi:hypothetical protein
VGCWLKIEMRLGKRKKGGIIKNEGGVDFYQYLSSSW